MGIKKQITDGRFHMMQSLEFILPKWSVHGCNEYLISLLSWYES